MLRQALQHHPTITMTQCCAWMAAAAADGAHSHSHSSNTDYDQQLLQGVRLWVKDCLLNEATPSPEGTPTADTPAGAAGTRTGARKPLGKRHHSILQAALDASDELQLWVMKQARGRAAGETKWAAAWA
jgi:hypothetical protein